MDDSTREHRLEALHRATRELMAAETRESVAERGVAAAAEIIGLEASGIYLYDGDAEGLTPTAVTEVGREMIDDLPTFREGNSIAWRVFETGETAFLDDVREDPDIYNPATPMRTELILPLGDHGVLVSGSTEPGAFDEADQSLGQVLAANIEAALDQVEREERLRQQNERLERFASIVSHDLRNPLSVARGYLELAREDGTPEQFDRIEAAHDRMADIIDDLLTLAREGEQIGETEPVDLREAATDAWRVVTEAGSAATLDPPERAVIEADYDRLCQLLENLFRNSVEHGSPSPDSHARQDAAEHHSSSPGSHARQDAAEHSDRAITVSVELIDGGFAVADDGVGIPAEERGRVFEAGHSTTDAGTGFGLAIVAEIADAHGWDVTLSESEEGGARFEFTNVAFAEN